jgi:hypothetical protein
MTSAEFLIPMLVLFLTILTVGYRLETKLSETNAWLARIHGALISRADSR